MSADSNRADAGPMRESAGPGAGLVALLAALFIRGLRATVRMRFHGEGEVRRLEQSDQRYILAFWHRHLLLMPYAYRGRRISVLISRSRDGELIARTVRHLGIDSCRGSSSRGGAAGLRELLRKAREGYDLAFTPDGPRGPVGRVQPGIVAAAAATGWPIVPVALAASPCRRLQSWDRFVVPLPGARVHFVFGSSLSVARGADLGAAAQELGLRLDVAEQEAESLAQGRAQCAA